MIQPSRQVFFSGCLVFELAKDSVAMRDVLFHSLLWRACMGEAACPKFGQLFAILAFMLSAFISLRFMIWREKNHSHLNRCDVFPPSIEHEPALGEFAGSRLFRMKCNLTADGCEPSLVTLATVQELGTVLSCFSKHGGLPRLVAWAAVLQATELCSFPTFPKFGC